MTESAIRNFRKFIQRPFLNFVETRPRLNYWYLILKNIILGLRQDGGLHLAAGIAFFALFSLFPILLISVSILGFKFNQPGAAPGMMEFLSDFLPGHMDIIMKNFEAIAKDREKIGILGILILLWAGRGTFLAMEYSLNRVWDLPSRRSIIGRNLVALSLIFILLMIAGSSMAISTVVAYLSQIKVPILNVRISEFAIYAALNKWIFSTLLIFVVFLVLFKVLPHCRITFRQAFPGALLATLLWKISDLCYSWYISNVARMSELYGSLGGILGVMLWFYVAAIIFLAGAKLNIVRLRLRKENGFTECEAE